MIDFHLKKRYSGYTKHILSILIRWKYGQALSTIEFWDQSISKTISFFVIWFDIPYERIWFKQYGSPPYFHKHLDELLPYYWIDRRCAIEWSPRSPDLTFLRYFSLRYVMHSIFQCKPNKYDALKEQIRTVFKIFQFKLFRTPLIGFLIYLRIAKLKVAIISTSTVILFHYRIPHNNSQKLLNQLIQR